MLKEKMLVIKKTAFETSICLINVELLHSCIVALSQYCTTTLTHYSTGTLLHCHTAAPFVADKAISLIISNHNTLFKFRKKIFELFPRTT